MLAAKETPPNWGYFLSIDVQEIAQDNEKLDLVMEDVYPMLVGTKIDLEDPAASPENILQLFKIAQLQMEVKTMYLEEAEAQINHVEAIVEAKDSEIRKLRTLSLGPESNIIAQEMDSMQQKIQDLEERNESLNRELGETGEILSSELQNVKELTRLLSEERDKNAKTEEINQRMRKDIGEFKLKLSSQRENFKNSDEGLLKNVVKEKNAEIGRYINEIQLLTYSNADLSSEVNAMTQELEATVVELERTAKDIEHYEKRIIKSDAVVDQLIQEKESLKFKLDELSDQLQARGANDDSLLEELQTENARQRKLMRESTMNLNDKAVTIERLTAELKSLQEELKSFGAESIKQELSNRDETIQTLKEKLEESYRDIELLSVDWDNLDALIKSKENSATVETLKSHFDESNGLKEKINLYKQKRKADFTKIKNSDILLMEKENELIDLRQKTANYESGIYGLDQAMREIKELKFQKSFRDKNIVELTTRINEYEVQACDFIEENQELRKSLGIDEKTSIDLSNIRNARHVEMEQLKSLNLALQSEIDKLEEERLKLKASIRLNAIQVGERAVKMGLSAEDLIAVEDYAAKLRHASIDDANGSFSVAVDDIKERGLRPHIKNEQLEKLTNEIERLHFENSEARSALKEHEDMVSTMKDENRALESGIREISLTLIKTRGTNSSEKSENVSESVTFPVVHKLINILEKKSKRERARDIGRLRASDDIIEMNLVLRDELGETRLQLDKTSQELYKLKFDYEKTLEDRSRWKERAEAPKKRLLYLPPELALGTVHDYSALVEQLIECLLDLQAKDKEIVENRKSLEQFHEKYSVLSSRQNILYREFHEQEAEHDTKVKALEDALSVAKSQKELAEIKARELGNAVTAMENGPDETNRAFIISQRHLISLKSNELNLIRRYKAMSEVESHLRKQNTSLQEDIRTLDKVARETILRLLRSKNEALFKVDSLLKKFEDSVPAVRLAETENKLQNYVSKTKVLLEREQEWIYQRNKQEAELHEFRKLQDENDKLQMQYLDAHEMAIKMEEALGVLSNQFSSGGPVSREQLVQAHQKIAKLEVELEVSHKRAELAEHRDSMMQQVEHELKSRLDTVDRMYIEAMEENMNLRQEEMEYKNAYAGGANKDENEKNLQIISDSEKQISVLTNEVAKYKDLADIASQQASDLLRMHKVDQKEKEIMQAAIQELQMEGDEKLLIGKMHHHIIALQVSEAGVLRKLEILNSKCLKLESSVVQLEKAIDQREKTIYEMHFDGKNRIRILQGTVSELRTRMSGLVLFEKHERTCRMVQSLNARKLEIETALKNAISDKRIIDDKLVETLLKVENQDQLILALKDSNPNVNIIQSWHKKMSENQLSELKIHRELIHVKNSERTAMIELEETVNRASKYEEDLVKLQTDFDSHQIDWEKRELALELKVQQLEEEREKIFQAATMSELKESLPDRTLPIHQQLEVALRLLVERSKLLAAQEIRMSLLEGNNLSYQDRVEQLESKSLYKEMQLHDLKKNNFTNSTDEGIKAAEKRFKELLRKREEIAIRSAQEMIASLRRQLETKNNMVEKYQKMMIEMREKLGNQQLNDQTQINNLTEKINDINELDNFKLQRGTKSKELNHSDFYQTALTDLEKLVQIKNEEVVSLQNKLDDYKANQQEESSRIISDLKEEISFRDRQIEEMNINISELEAKMEEMELELQQRNSYTELNQKVAKLTKELSKKERENSKHAQAILELKQLLQTNTNELDAINTRNEINPPASVISQINQKNSKISQLESKIERIKQVAEKYHKDALTLDNKNKKLMELKTKLSDNLAKRDKDANQFSINAQRFQKLLQEKEHILSQFESQFNKSNQERESLRIQLMEYQSQLVNLKKSTRQRGKNSTISSSKTSVKKCRSTN